MREGRRGEEGRSHWALFLKTHIIFHLGLIDQRNLSIIPVMQFSLTSLDLRVGESPETSLYEVINQGAMYQRVTGNFLGGWVEDLASWSPLWES